MQVNTMDMLIINDVQKNEDQISAILVQTQIILKQFIHRYSQYKLRLWHFLLQHHEQTSDPLIHEADTRISVADVGILF